MAYAASVVARIRARALSLSFYLPAYLFVLFFVIVTDADLSAESHSGMARRHNCHTPVC